MHIGKFSNPSFFVHRMEHISPISEYFISMHLMADIEKYFIFLKVVYLQQGLNDFNSTQRWSHMSAISGRLLKYYFS